MNDGYCFLKNRLWEHLVQKEREYQNLLRLTLEQKTQELHHLQLQYKSNGESFSLCFDIGIKEGQKNLTYTLKKWLRLPYSILILVGILEEAKLDRNHYGQGRALTHSSKKVS